MWTLDTNSVNDYVKACVAGYVCRREMSDEPNDGVAIDMDVDSARPWYQIHVGGTEEAFQKVIVEAEDVVVKDLKDTAARAGVLAEANRFEREIFPAPSPRTNIRSIEGETARVDAMMNLRLDERLGTRHGGLQTRFSRSKTDFSWARCSAHVR